MNQLVVMVFFLGLMLLQALLMLFLTVRSRLKALEQRLARLEQLSEGLPAAARASAASSVTQASAASSVPEASPPATGSQGARGGRGSHDSWALPVSPGTAASPPPPAVRPSRPAVVSASGAEAAVGKPWLSPALQRQLVENWTGILGVVVLVAGVTFVMVNLALRLGPLPRFLITLLVGAALMLPSLVAPHTSRWRPLALWLRSGGASLILLACLAGGALPELGLRWLTSPAPALALVLAGIGVNLALAALSGSQSLASLHVLINLVPLVLVPQNAITGSIATAVCLGGQVLPRRRSWDRHRLLVFCGYSLFLLTWALRCWPALQASPLLRGAGVAAAALVFVGGVLLARRSWGPNPPLTALRLAVPISGWTGIALTLLALPPLGWVRAASLVVAALLAAWVGWHTWARARWFHLCHSLIAQSLVLAALLSLQPLVPSGLLLVTVLLVESLLFLAVSLVEGEPLLQRFAWLGVVLFAGLLLLQGLVIADSVALASTRPLIQNTGLLLLSSVLLAGLSILRQQRSLPLPQPWVLVALHGLTGSLAFVATALLCPAPWRPLLALGSMGPLLVAARRTRVRGLGLAITVAVGALHWVVWSWMLGSSPAAAATPQQVLPLLGLALITALTSPWSLRLPFALALAMGSSMLGAWFLLAPLSPLLAVAAWLLLSLAGLALANRLNLPSDEATAALVIALVPLLSAVAVFPALVGGSDTPLALGGVTLPARMGMYPLLLAVLLAWRFLRPCPALAASGLWRVVHPLLVETWLLALVGIVLREVSEPWQPLAWSLLAVGLISPLGRVLLAPRVIVYGLLLYLESLLALTLLMGHSAGLAQVAILVQVLVAALAPRWLPAMVDTLAEGPLALKLNTPQRLALLQRWLWYPLFAVVALHLSQRYDHSALTLLWAIQALAIAVLSVVLRDAPMRLVSLLALGVCLARLLAIDLAEADLGLRGLVFIGVGLLMLGIHSLYTRFSERFR